LSASPLSLETARKIHLEPDVFTLGLHDTTKKRTNFCWMRPIHTLRKEANMNNRERIPPQLAQEASKQAVQEISSMLDEKQLEEIVGAGWPLGLSGVQRVIEQTGGLVLKKDPRLNRSLSAPKQLESAPFHHSPPRPPSSVRSGEIALLVVTHAGRLNVVTRQQFGL
jgi:hypothetical protein